MVALSALVFTLNGSEAPHKCYMYVSSKVRNTPKSCTIRMMIICWFYKNKKCSSMLDTFVGHEYNVILAIMTSTYHNIIQKKKRVKYI